MTAPAAHCEKCGARGRVKESDARADGQRRRRVHCTACPHRWTAINGEWPTRGRPRRQVRCVETGEVFPSADAAARAVFVVPKTVEKALTKGYRAGGYHWERV